MMIEIPEELIEEQIRNVTETKIRNISREMIRKLIQDIVDKSEEDIKTKVNNILDSEIHRIIKGCVDSRVKWIFNCFNTTGVEDPEKDYAFKQGIKIAYLAISKFGVDDELKDKICQYAGREFAEEILSNYEKRERMVKSIIKILKACGKESIDNVIKDCALTDNQL